MSPTCATSNKQTDVGLGCGNSKASRPGPIPLMKKLVESIDLDKYPQMSQPSQGEIPACHWSKKKFGCSGDSKRNLHYVLHSPLHNKGLNYPAAVTALAEKLERGEKMYGYPSCVGCCLKYPFLSSSCNWRGRLGKRQKRISNDMKVTGFLLIKL